MRICGRHIALLLLVPLALTACGSGDDGGTSSGPNGINMPPVITGTPTTQLAAGTAYSFVPQAADPNGDALTFSATNVPGWATFNATNGALTGTPSESDVGMTGMITIEVSDSRSVAQLPAFRIQVMSTGTAPPPTVPSPVVNHPPVINGNPATAATVGVEYTFAPVAEDQDNDTLTFSIQNRPTWATFTESTGQLRGTPAAGDVGATNNIVISVSDGKETVALQAFNLQVNTVAPPANRAPTITGTPLASATVGTAYSFRPVASDPDGNALVYSIQNKPTWATFSTSTGRLAGTPATADIGTTAGITIAVNDGTVTVPLPAFSISVVAPPNRAPTISGTPGVTATVGTAYAFQPTAADADGNTLTFQITNKPTWATFNSSTGRLSGTPATADIGNSGSITISVSDGTASASLSSFVIAVSAAPNRAPTISGTPSVSVTVGAAYTFTPTASDPDGNTLTFQISNKPGWATFNPSTGQLSGTPALSDVGTSASIVISVSDGTLSASLSAFSISILQVANGSTTVAWTAPTLNTDGSALTNLAGFRVAYGQSATNLDQSATVNNPSVSEYTVNNLTPGQWFFAVYAINSNGVESDVSNVASKTVP